MGNIDVSVIILNYFGERVLKQAINGVLNQKIDNKKIEILIPDNNSSDNSKAIIENYKKRYNNVFPIYLDKNYGFAGGNKRALEHAKGKYIVLLNNDCVPDEDWIINLIKVKEHSKNIFAVTSKILIYPKYFKLVLNTTQVVVSCQLISSHLITFGRDKYIDLEYSQKDNVIEIDVPYDARVDFEIRLKINYINGANKLEITSPYLNIGKHITKNTAIISINTKLKFVQETCFDKIQNAGSLTFQDGYSRDIGATVEKGVGGCENDRGQYDFDREVSSFCGAAVLFEKAKIEEIGFLDDEFFMYYEDVELSERARLAGYKIIYSHKAVVRHLHAFSSKEWSPFFIYHVEKGRLLHTFFHFPLSIFIKEYIALANFSVLRLLGNLIRKRMRFKHDIEYIKVIIYFMLNLVRLIKKRNMMNNHTTITRQEMYLEILTGRWLLH